MYNLLLLFVSLALRFCSVVVDGRAANACFINETVLRISLYIARARLSVCLSLCVFVFCLLVYVQNDGAGACAHSLTHSL